MKTRKHILRTKSYRIQVQRSYRQLEILKAKDDSSTFYKVFVNTIPELRKYLREQLNRLEHEGNLPSDFYEEDDLIDDLFIEVYNNFESIKSDDDFYVFLFTHVNELLKEYVTKENYNHENVERLDRYEKVERDKMLEKLTSQLDGDIVFKEELDDISYQQQQPDFQTIIEVDTQQTMDDSIDKDLELNWTSNQIEGFIDKLPNEERNIGLLYVYFHLTIPEIIQVTKNSREEVDSVVTSLRNMLTEDYFKE